MSIRITCESCGKSLLAKDEHAGKKAKCPDCGSVIVVPAQEVLEAEAIAHDEFALTNSDDDGPSANEERLCPACGESIKNAARKCRYCGEIFDASLKRTAGRRGSNRRSNTPATADLGKRFLGALADGVAGIIFVAPGYMLAFAAGVEDEGDELTPLMLAAVATFLLGVLALCGLQLYLLSTRSQSIGKYFVKTQIYDYETDAPAGFVKCFLLRGLVNWVLTMIPCFGSLYGLVDTLCIFGDEHRCLHDQLAGTYVVDIS